MSAVSTLTVKILNPKARNNMNTAPRTVPLSVRFYLGLSSTPDVRVGLFIAVVMFAVAILPATMVHDNRIFGAWLATWIFFGVGMCALCLPIRAWFVGKKAVRLLQTGTTAQAKFFGVNLPGTKGAAYPPPIVGFTYQVEDKTYSVSTYVFDASSLTTNTAKDVFYDPMRPEQSVVLPDAIHFDEQSGCFECSLLRYMPLLLAVSIICVEIVVIGVLAVRAT